MEPFRTAIIHCPRCRQAELTGGDMRHCMQCKGSWVPEETLHAHISAMTAEVKPRVEWTVTHQRIGLPCAVCKHTMETLLLFQIAVDRCHSHGVWFDKDELAEVLRRSTIKPAQPSDPGTTLAVAELAGEGALAVGEVAVDAGILEGVLDVLGGIFSAIDF
ncbi:MAG: zf-TFIIB domain-containing protein [Myxococcota bacterium]|nr:zf-TFIIB domain-containing protein [Myxococcota bacterium]